VPLKIVLKNEIILPDDYITKNDFDEITENQEDFEGIVAFLEDDLMSVFNFTNGLSGFIEKIEWLKDKEGGHFLDNFIESEDLN